MTVKLIKNGAWTRILVDGSDDLAEAQRLTGVRLEPGFGTAMDSPILVHVAQAQTDGLAVWEIIVVGHAANLITVEPKQGLPLFDRLEVDLNQHRLDRDDKDAIKYELVQGGFEAATQILDAIESDLMDIHQAVHEIEISRGSPRTFGVSDLLPIDENLTGVDRVLSYAAQSLGQFTHLARVTRCEAKGASGVKRQKLDDLVAIGEAGQRRVQFIADRQRFQARAVEQVIATSDLNVVKIFTILWTIFLPGTALINWYGQNFHVMPELSWYWSSWVQLAGVLVLTLIPILTIKHSGQLR